VNASVPEEIIKGPGLMMAFIEFIKVEIRSNADMGRQELKNGCSAKNTNQRQS
jgi:hypothetical protein